MLKHEPNKLRMCKKRRRKNGLKCEKVTRNAAVDEFVVFLRLWHFDAICDDLAGALVVSVRYNTT